MVHYKPCDCGRTYLRLDGGVLGRVDDMIHIAGTNIFPSQIQNLLHEMDEFSQEWELAVPKLGSGKRLRVRVEPAHAFITETRLKQAIDLLIESVKYRVSVTLEVEVVEIGSLPRYEGKASRIIREDLPVDS